MKHKTAILDITVPITPGMPVWPGDPPVQLERFSAIANGDAANISRLACCVHTGTHVDAPLHFIEHGQAVEQLALDVLIGPALVVELDDTVEAITPTHLEALALPPETTRVLFKTRNSALWHNPEHAFVPDFVALTSEAAIWLVECGMQLVGVDYASVQRFADESPRTHQVLLEAGVVIVEHVNLLHVSPGLYHLICLPLKLVGSDGAPARAVLMQHQS